jgi:hypothetical protein
LEQKRGYVNDLDSLNLDYFAKVFAKKVKRSKKLEVDPSKKIPPGRVLGNRVFLARAGADVVCIKGFLAISKCAFARALLAHFAVFATCALPKVASRAQNRCFTPYL